MPDDDFDIESLAAYLHLGAAQVQKLAERGKLPGRRVAGNWRFARGEIHHWLEERIGLSADDELLRVEGALQRSAGEFDEGPPSIAAMLPLEAIEIPLEARTRNSVITSMVDVAARTGWLWDPAKMTEAVRSREDMHPTALEIGVALLHPRRPLPTILAQPFLALGRTERGIPFGGSRGVLTDNFFLICSSDDRLHLQVLARLSRLIASPDFLVQLRAAPDARAVLELIAQQERALREQGTGN
jgi:PTS system nitrogen regulatory IIA component